MKQYALLFIALGLTGLTFGQSGGLQDGNNCFVKGNYACAIEKYKEVILLADKRQQKIAQDNLKQAEKCFELVQVADAAFKGKDFDRAKEIYESILIENPKDEYSKAQIKKCKEALFVPAQLPSKILGLMERCSGDNRLETYSLVGASLGTDAKYWLLFEGGREVRRFMGDTLKLAPSRTAEYRIYPENDLNKFVEFEIIVHTVPTITGVITGKDEVCPGEQFTLTVDQSNLDRSIALNWYKIEQSNSIRKSVGSGIQITDFIHTGTTYEVEASLKGCISGSKLIKSISVVPIPSRPIIEKHVFKGGSSQKAEISLSTHEGASVKYEWSTDAFNTKATVNKPLITVPLKNGANIINVKAVDQCGSSSSTAVYLINKPRAGYFFMNFGTVVNDVKTIETFMVTLGFKNIYFRVKANPSILGNTDLYSTQFSNSDLEITNSGRVTNFPPATGQYYVVNDQMMRNRQAATLGTSFGGRKLRFYLGGGYGQRTNLWGFNLHSYNSNSNLGNGWAKNINQSWKGLEGEGGLFLKLGHFNLMGGASAIFDSKLNAPFVDFHIGIGFSTR
jgi:hypothetical protein